MGHIIQVGYALYKYPVIFAGLRVRKQVFYEEMGNSRERDLIKDMPAMVRSVQVVAGLANIMPIFVQRRGVDRGIFCLMPTFVQWCPRVKRYALLYRGIQTTGMSKALYTSSLDLLGHTAMTARRLFVHITTSVCNQVLIYTAE